MRVRHATRLWHLHRSARLSTQTSWLQPACELVMHCNLCGNIYPFSGVHHCLFVYQQLFPVTKDEVCRNYQSPQSEEHIQKHAHERTALGQYQGVR